MTNTAFEKDWDLSHWAYLHGKPTGSAVFKQCPEDFIVTEKLGFELTDSGENLFLLIEKHQLNTQQVCEYLAKFFKKRLRDIGYAGMKDKQSVSRQWFSVQMNVKQEPELENLGTDNIRLIKATRHNKKLKIGALQANGFTIRLRNVSDKVELESRLQTVSEQGAPNYFGLQRFGFKGNNLNWANRWVSGEELRNKKIRSFALSATRSYLFNEVVSQRISQQMFETASNGDVFQLSGTQSYFIEDVSEGITQRIAQGDLLLTAPLFGDGELVSSGAILELEVGIADANPDWLSLLRSQGLKQERRAITLVPQQVEWTWQNDDAIVSFEIPSGCFATSVLRECINLIEQPDQEER